jgi:membrane-associated protease RseP (regulator of RpoE activity)
MFVASLAFSTVLVSAALAQTGASAAPADPTSETAAEPTPRAEPQVNGEAMVTIEPTGNQAVARKDVPWLGVGASEASEALSAQLNLQPGVGLVVTYVAPDSPAAKSGVRKNDVLVEFDDQPLVHPAQLRKLVRVRKEGDPVKLGFYRAGKHDTVSITLGRTRMEGVSEELGHALEGNLSELHQQLKDLRLNEAVTEQMRALRESMGNLVNQKEVQENIRQGMEQARKAIQDAMRTVTNAEPLRKVLENLDRSRVVVDEKANVIVRSSGKTVRSMVKSDDNGTIVLIRNPRLYLTAHDKDGKLVFDGPIETEDERGKVPPEVWDRVEPLLDQMHPDPEPADPKHGQ